MEFFKSFKFTIDTLDNMFKN